MVLLFFFFFLSVLEFFFSFSCINAKKLYIIIYLWGPIYKLYLYIYYGAQDVLVHVYIVEWLSQANESVHPLTRLSFFCGENI